MGAWRPFRQQTSKQRRYPAQPGGKVNRPTAATAAVAIAFSRGSPRKKSPLKTSTHYQVKIRVSLEATGHGQKQQLVHRTGTSCNIPALPYIPRSRNKFPSRLVRPRNLIGLMGLLDHRGLHNGRYPHWCTNSDRRGPTIRRWSPCVNGWSPIGGCTLPVQHRSALLDTHVEAQAPT